MKFNNNLYHFSALSLTLAALLGCGGSAEEKREEQKMETKPVVTQVSILQKGKLEATLSLPGELVAFQQVDLYAKVSSFVKRLYVDVGSQVKKGQLLATMEAPELSSQAAGAQSKLRSFEALYIASKANYDRLLETSKTPGTISPNDLDIALAKQKSDYAQYQSAVAAYREVSDTRNYLEIRAPFAGIISGRNVSAGAYVGPSGKGSEMPMFTLQEQKKLRLAVLVPEAYTSYLSNQAVITFNVKSRPGEQFTARVNRLSGALDNRLRAERVEMDVYNPNGKLLPGTVAEIKIPLPAQDSTFIIPTSALINSSLGLFVIKDSANKAAWIKVRQGRQSGDLTEIFADGLAVGDSIVTSANEEIRKGADLGKVQVK